MANDIDEGLAELLKPINDLTQNWEVPLADTLSKYVEDLQKVDVTVNEGRISVNFSQAALLLQGSASIYSKKVDFLQKLVTEALKMMRRSPSYDEMEETNDEDPNTEPGLRPRRGKRQTLDTARELDYLQTRLGKNIDEDEEICLEELKIFLLSSSITPGQLVANRQGLDNTSINLYGDVSGAKWDLMGRKEDFFLNSQYVSNAGCLVDEISVTRHMVTNAAKPKLPSSKGDHCGSPDKSLLDIVPDKSDPYEAAYDDVPSPVSECRGFQNSRATPEIDPWAQLDPHEVVDAEGDSLTQLDSNEEIEPEFDPWAQLDPHEQVEVSKPMKIGKTFKLPPSLTKGIKRPGKLLPPISEYLMNEMSSILFKQDREKMPNIAPALYDLAVMEISRTKREAELATTNGHAENEVDHAEHSDEDISDDVVDDLDISVNLPDPHVADGYDNFEAIAARKVAKLLKSPDILTQSDLAKKVAKWHRIMGPKLEILGKRQIFDTSVYGSKILEKFPAGPNRSESLAFSTLVQGLSGEETARYFLSILMLASSGNLEISSVPGSDPHLGMDNVVLNLLSIRKPRDSLEQFLSPSCTFDETGSSVELELVGNLRISSVKVRAAKDLNFSIP